uniref:Uncharacterized protein n=1 Tax=Rhizophora mucronata TaxID=61149 RepID=A0A2P2P3C5_RHIMU
MLHVTSSSHSFSLLLWCILCCLSANSSFPHIFATGTFACCHTSSFSFMI